MKLVELSENYLSLKIVTHLEIYVGQHYDDFYR